MFEEKIRRWKMTGLGGVIPEKGGEKSGTRVTWRTSIATNKDPRMGSSGRPDIEWRGMKNRTVGRGKWQCKDQAWTIKQLLPHGDRQTSLFLQRWQREPVKPEATLWFTDDFPEQPFTRPDTPICPDPRIPMPVFSTGSSGQSPNTLG